MTHTEAKIALIQAGIRKMNDVVFEVPSFTENRIHVVTVLEGKATYCDCKWTAEGGWTRILKDGTCHKCAHALAVEQYVAEEQRQLVASAVESVQETSVLIYGPIIEYSTLEVMRNDYGHYPVYRIDRGPWVKMTEQGFFTERRAEEWLKAYRAISEPTVIAEAVEVVKVADKKQERGILGRLTVAEEQVSIRRGYLTREPGVRRDEKYGIILR